MDHSIHNEDISNMLSTNCPVQLKPRFICEEDASQKVPDVIEREHLPTQVGYDKLQSGRDPTEDNKQMHLLQQLF